MVRFNHFVLIKNTSFFRNLWCPLVPDIEDSPVNVISVVNIFPTLCFSFYFCLQFLTPPKNVYFLKSKLCIFPYGYFYFINRKSSPFHRWVSVLMHSLFTFNSDPLGIVEGYDTSCCCSVAQSCLTLCDPMDCSTPGFPVHHHLPCPSPSMSLLKIMSIVDAIQPSLNWLFIFF